MVDKPSRAHLVKRGASGPAKEGLVQGPFELPYEALLVICGQVGGERERDKGE